MKPLDQFTRDEKSQLLYLETRLVDYSGRVDTRKMNKTDHDTMENWKKEGFVSYGRICHADVTDGGTMWCQFSDEAWQYAHQARKNRATASWNNRTWQTTEEYRNS